MRLTEALDFYNNKGDLHKYTHFEPTWQDISLKKEYKKREVKRKKEMIEIFDEED